MTAGTPEQGLAGAGRPSVLPGGVELTGDVRGQRDFVVFGTVDGNIDIEGLLIVEQGGRVDGHVRARAVTVRGSVTADVFAVESLRVETTGAVIGDLTAPSIHVDDGAHVLGALQAALRPEAPSAKAASQEAAKEETAASHASSKQAAGLLLIQARARGRGTGKLEKVGPPPPRMPPLGRMRARRRSAGVGSLDDCLSGYEG